MQIIVMHSKITHAKSITLSTRHIVLAVLIFLIFTIVCSAMMTALTFRFSTSEMPFIRDMVPLQMAVTHDDSAKERYVKENLTAMAVKLGEMQAQLIRLDALGERVQGLAGVKPEEFNFKELPGRGGAESTTKGAELNMQEFQAALDAMSRDVERRSDFMSVVETKLMGFSCSRNFCRPFNQSMLGIMLQALAGVSILFRS